MVKHSALILTFTSLTTIGLLAGCGDKDTDDTGTAGDDTGSSAGPDFCSDYVEGYCYLTGEYTEDITLTADTFYVLQGGVFIGDDTNETVLTIEPGTTIFGDSATDGFLAIRRNSRIEAVGTADAPIVFTSAVAEGSRARADWGGLILNGNAPINDCSDGTADAGDCQAEGEGSTGTYGGTDPADNSGTLRYVRVEFGGTEITTDNEVNGIAFQGVGSGTSVSYLQVHYNKDDGVEFFGGTVDVDHLVLSGIGDDALDWTSGWTGSASHVVILQGSDAGDRGMECDNNGDVNNAQPFSDPSISKVTIVNGNADAIGALFRAGTKATVSDIAITGPGACLDVDDAQTWENGADGSLSLSYAMLSCDSNFKEDDDVDSELFVEDWFDAGTGNATTDDLGLDGWVPTSDSPLVGAGSGGGTIGAFEAGDDWTAGWTTTASN